MGGIRSCTVQTLEDGKHRIFAGRGSHGDEVLLEKVSYNAET